MTMKSLQFIELFVSTIVSALLGGVCFLILILKLDFLLFGVILLFFMILLAPKKDKIF